MSILDNIEFMLEQDVFIKLNEDDAESDKNKEQKQDKKEEKPEEKEKPEENKEESGDDAEEDDENLDDEDYDDDYSDDEELTSEQLGKVQQLKYIFNDLNNMYDICYTLLTYNKKIKNILYVIKKSLDYFKLIINNIKQYDDKLDDIIKYFRNNNYYIYKYISIQIEKIEKNISKEK